MTMFETKLERDLIALRDNNLRLGDLTQKAVEQAVIALKNLDSGLAQHIITQDAALNRLRFQIEKDAYKITAMQQPTARDMRSIMVAIHIAVELERIADHAVDICKLTLEIANSPMRRIPTEIQQMAFIGGQMLRSSMDAYIKWDATLAQAIFARDDEVDSLYRVVHRNLVKEMETHRSHVLCATYYLWVANNLERVADRVTNICERVVFLVTGDVQEETEG